MKQNSRGGPQLVCYAEDSNGVKKPTAICWTNQSANWSNSKMKKKESKKKKLSKFRRVKMFGTELEKQVDEEIN